MQGRKDITTPLLIKRGGKLYKFLYLTFSQDGSIFLTYPRKGGYEVTSSVDVPPITGTSKLSLRRKMTGQTLPKISFHPGKMSIHVNVNKQGDVFKPDTKVLNMGEGVVVFPLCQVVIPADVNYLDTYSSSKYFKPLEIEVKNPIGSLSLLFWVHPPGGYIDLEDLPNVNTLKQFSSVIIPRMFQHQFLKKYTCTLFIHDLGVREKTENKSFSIITSVYNVQQPYIFELIPK